MDMTVVSYKAKNNKSVIFLWYLYNDAKVSDVKEKKTDIILHCNESKGGIENTHKYATVDTCKNGSKVFSMCVYSTIW